MKNSAIMLLLLLCPLLSICQKYEAWKYEAPKIKAYIPSAAFTFLAGMSDGLRDAAMYRMDGYSDFWNGKQSWLNKYKDRDKTAGPAYFGSTSFLVFTTDGAHMSNMLTHQFTGLAFAFYPSSEHKTFGRKVIETVAYNVIREVGHTIVYSVVFKPQGRD